MTPNLDIWLKRAREVWAERSASAIPFAVSMFAAVYGSQSPQLNSLNDQLKQFGESSGGSSSSLHIQQEYAIDALRNAIAEIENGLVVNLRAQVAGEVLSELVGLGKEILGDDTESAKNVAAVLIAAAFEDLMRRLGSEFAGLSGRPKLEEVLISLKSAGVLKGGEIGVAQSYLKLRNDSLHADWPNVQKSQVQACTAFIESLVLKHLG